MLRWHSVSERCEYMSVSVHVCLYLNIFNFNAYKHCFLQTNMNKMLEIYMFYNSKMFKFSVEYVT